jgi:hypothetical protein
VKTFNNRFQLDVLPSKRVTEPHRQSDLRLKTSATIILTEECNQWRHQLFAGRDHAYTEDGVNATVANRLPKIRTRER